MAPRPPAFNPATDAPITIGQPGYGPEARPLPPQPNPRPTRVLPPSREPGIWASDESYASTTPVQALVALFPYPPQAATPDAKSITDGCKTRMASALDFVRKAEALPRLPESIRKCLGAKLYLFCAEYAAQIVKEDKQHGMPNQYLEAVVVLTREAARKHHAEQCRGTGLSTTADDIYVNTIALFEHMQQTLEWPWID